MNLWIFFCIIIIIGVTGDALKKAFGENDISHHQASGYL